MTGVTTRMRDLPTRLVCATTVLMVLAACGGEVDRPPAASSSASTVGAAGETAQVEHAYGTTEVDCSAERVVTLGWGATEAALSVAVVPVAIPRGSGNGGNADGYHPWVADHLAENDIDPPALLSTNAGDEPPLEEIAAFAPDLVLATEAGITRAQYDLLTRIAPTVVHPGRAWNTPWREVVEISGAALCRSDQAREVLDDIDTLTEEAAAEHPEFAGTSITAAEVYDGQLLLYSPPEPRAELLADLGFTVDGYGAEDGYSDLSLERLDEITSDVVLMYHPSDTAREDFEASPASELMSQYDAGSVASVVGEAEVAAVSPPTALSWPWVVDGFTAELAEAVS